MFRSLFKSSTTNTLLAQRLRLLNQFQHPTKGYIVTSTLPPIDPPTATLYEHVYREFPRHGSKIALVDGVTGRECSYNELNETTANFSSALRRQGLQEGDVLAIVSPNSLQYPVVIFGTLALGGVVTTCNPTLGEEELAYQFKNSNAKVVATVPTVLSTVQRAAEMSGVNKIIVIDDSDQSSSTSDGLIAYNSLIQDSGSLFNHTPRPLNSTAILPYSSGTTGLPKGVMLSHQNIVANLSQSVHDELLMYSREGTTITGLLPFFHLYGMIVLFLSLSAGSKIITMPKFEPGLFLGSVQRYRINVGHLVPPILLFLANHSDIEKYDLFSLEDVMVAGAPLSGEAITSVKERIKCNIIRQGYGLSEAGVTHITPRSLSTSKPNSIGKVIRSVSAKVVDIDSGVELPAYKEGEMFVRSPCVMKGYLNRPKDTKQCLSSDGWLSTGDIGYYDDEECFYIIDRLKELIKVKGYQVAPAELEALLLTHPKIADAAVIGVPNERLGEAPKAFVVKQDDNLSQSEVVQFIASKVAPHKQLVGGVEFITEIPKSPSGKILRRTLK